MRLLLYRVGRNLNRCIRTCLSFGIREIDLLECQESWISELRSRHRRGVRVRTVADWPDESILPLDPRGRRLLSQTDWAAVGVLVIGGEIAGLPARLRVDAAKVDGAGGDDLTVETALAAALYARAVGMART